MNHIRIFNMNSKFEREEKNLLECVNRRKIETLDINHTKRHNFPSNCTNSIENPNLDALGVIAQITVLGIGFGSAGVPHRGADNAGEATEGSLGSPEAAKGEDGDLNGSGGLVAGRIWEADG